MLNSENNMKNEKECINILAVEVFDLHLLPERIVPFQNFRFLAFSFLQLVKTLIFIVEFLDNETKKKQFCI